MPAMTFTVGKTRIGSRAYKSTSYVTDTRHIQVLSVDDNTVAFAVGHTTLNSGGATTNEADQAFDGTPTESVVANNAVITTTTTLATGTANFTHKRACHHDQVVASVDATTSTIVMGVDGFSLQKTADFSMAYVTKTTLA